MSMNYHTGTLHSQVHHCIRSSQSTQLISPFYAREGELATSSSFRGKETTQNRMTHFHIQFESRRTWLYRLGWSSHTACYWISLTESIWSSPRSADISPSLVPGSLPSFGAAAVTYWAQFQALPPNVKQNTLEDEYCASFFWGTLTMWPTTSWQNTGVARNQTWFDQKC